MPKPCEKGYHPCMLVPSLPLFNFDSLGGGVAWNQKYGPLVVSFFAKTGKENQCLSRGQDSCLFASIILLQDISNSVCLDLIIASTMAPIAPHLTEEELVRLRGWLGGPQKPEPLQLWEMHKEDRKVRRVKPLCLTAFRKALRGRTYNKVTETRGRKRSLGPRAVAAVNANRRL